MIMTMMMMTTTMIPNHITSFVETANQLNVLMVYTVQYMFLQSTFCDYEQQSWIKTIDAQTRLVLIAKQLVEPAIRMISKVSTQDQRSEILFKYDDRSRKEQKQNM